MEPAHLVCFRIGKETFGVDISSVREIVRGPEITKVPGTPECVLGVVNLRGRILSVVDLGHRLGLTPSVVSGGSRILVTHLDGLTVGFLVDTATEVMKLPAEAIEPPPTFTDAVTVEYIEGVGKLDDELIIILNLTRVLSTSQTVAVAAAADKVQFATQA